MRLIAYSACVALAFSSLPQRVIAQATQQGHPSTPADLEATKRLLAEPIVFQKSFTQLSGVAKATLGDKAMILKANPGAVVTVQTVVTDAADEESATLLRKRRSEAVEGYLIARGVSPSQVLLGAEGEVAPTTFGRSPTATLQIGETSALSTALRLTLTRVQTTPGAEIFYIPTNLANDSTNVLCNPPKDAHFGNANQLGLADNTILQQRYTFVSRFRKVIVSVDHFVSPSKNPDQVDMRALSPDPRCQ